MTSSSTQLGDPGLNVSMSELEPMSISIPPLPALEFVVGEPIELGRPPPPTALVVVLLNTRHDECLSSLEHLRYLRDEYASEAGALVLLALYREPRSVVEQFCAERRASLPFRVAVDADGTACDRLLQAVGIAFQHPVAIVIGPDAKIQWAGKPRKPGLEVALAELLGPGRAPPPPPGPPSSWSDEVLKHLTVPELKRLLLEANVHDLHGVVEKQELIELIRARAPPHAA